VDNESKKSERGELEQLTDHMADLGRMFEKANRQIVDYLLHRDSQVAAEEKTPAPSADSSELAKQIAALGEKLDGLGSASAAAPAPGAASGTGASAEQLSELLKPIGEKLDVLDQQNGALYTTMEQLRTHVDGGVQSLAELLVPQPQEEESSSVSGGWLTAVLGPELISDGALGVPCEQLLEGVLAGDGPAQGLAGQLLVFRSASPERLPQLLKDLGEAYYRWQPKTAPGNNLFEEALVRFLQRTCENAGIYNSIELVHPGERFDSGRHNATSRGVEIVQVLGWIVLRDNGRVYTKAAVEVR
jgi:hypothetical protein